MVAYISTADIAALYLLLWKTRTTQTQILNIALGVLPTLTGAFV